MSYDPIAKVVPYSSIVGQSISLQDIDGRVIAQLNVMAPAGPPPGESHADYVKRLAAYIAGKLNK